MSVTDELLRNNKRYADGFDKGDLPLPPAKGVAVVACMDARLHVSKILGLEEGDAHIIRNAGGGLPTMRSARWPYRSGSWGRARSSWSTTPTAACSRSQTTTSDASSSRRPASAPSGRPRPSRTSTRTFARTSPASREAPSSRRRTWCEASSTRSKQAGYARSPRIDRSRAWAAGRCHYQSAEDVTEAPPSDGRRAGARTSRGSSPVALSEPRLVWFPPAATSIRARGSPAHGSPTSFTAGIRLFPPGLVGPESDDGSVEGDRPHAVGRPVAGCALRARPTRSWWTRPCAGRRRPASRCSRARRPSGSDNEAAPHGRPPR